jgi:hypothetical protein
MGTKPGIALTGLVWTAITLSGCESCSACRPSKPWGQATVSAAPTASPAFGWNNQSRNSTANPPDSTGVATATTQSARITDPGANPVAPMSPVNPVSNQSASTTAVTGFPTNSSSAAFPSSRAPDSLAARTPASSQPPAPFPGLPSSQTTAADVDQGSRITVPSNSPAPVPQPAWPSTRPAAGGTGMKTMDPPAINTSQTSDSTFQTRYPDVQPASTVPTTPKPAQNPNE